MLGPSGPQPCPQPQAPSPQMLPRVDSASQTLAQFQALERAVRGQTGSFSRPSPASPWCGMPSVTNGHEIPHEIPCPNFYHQEPHPCYLLP